MITTYRHLGWLITPLYLLFFWSILLVFHPLQMIALLFGYAPHKYVLDLMNFCLIQNFRLIGARIQIDFEALPDEGTPVVFVSNHQSMYDIPLMIWYLREWHPKFIAKTELGRGIPSISFALRNMGSVLIDRGNQRQALSSIEQFGQRMLREKRAAVIFPEGTRARDGKMRKFRPAGLITLLRAMPDAQVVPVVIEGSWEMLRWNFLPVPFGVRLGLTVCRPLERTGKDDITIVQECENRIRTKLGQVHLEPPPVTADVRDEVTV